MDNIKLKIFLIPRSQAPAGCFRAGDKIQRISQRLQPKMARQRLSAEQITGILLRWSEGDEHALDALIPLVYADLRRVASYHLRGERPGHTLQPTALVNEAYIKLAAWRKIQWQNRGHFFAVAAKAMRRILVDHARDRLRKKRGGGVTIVPVDEALVSAPEQGVDIMVLDECLKRLASVEERKAKVVELRFFGGLANDQIAEVLHIAPNTVMRDWNYAKAWLNRCIEGSDINEEDTTQEG
jgi:RNA polymerase sigma factor (TIGR02999 family)